ncbi:MAG: HlyD family type I secretion periplasmic adaptor subunit [Candidatus Thiodiazotropha sp.]|nr:HlyD family type I secretion periplasmic adaptor subunit [Candidatus Thiodiazotropha sp.]MCM8885622.1 HlyD family type I secretion periplasmic adaptor subunit [Candidatus Thiodiazotropha sp.]
MNTFVDNFRDAWKNRHTLGDSQKSRELSAFLPAALEIQETPPNPIAQWVTRSIIALLVSFMVWALFGEVNIVASAQGKILPGSRVKTIQPLQKGIVKNILVSEGEYVTQGQPLIELDGTRTGADESRLENELNSAKMKLAINDALLLRLGGDDDHQYKQEESGIDFENGSEGFALEQQHFERLLQEKWQQYQASVSTLISAREAAEADHEATKIEVHKLTKTLPIITKRAEIIKGLYSKKFATETEYLQLEQERIQQSHQLQEEKQRLTQLKATRKQAQQQISALRAETRAGVLTEITENRREIVALQEELIKASDVNQWQILYAPVSGQIQEMAVTTQGGVVTEAQPLMKIVPDEESLVVEVYLENKDIGFVEKAMSAEVKIHTFPFTKYGIVDAVIQTISDDAIFDEKRGFTYSMLLAMKKKTIDVDGREVRLMPGMEVTAEIKTGERRLIEYFLAPLLRHGQESLRER